MSCFRSPSLHNGQVDSLRSFLRVKLPNACSSGVVADDLIALNPTTEELVAAAHWAMTHDISEGFKLMLKELLKMIGFEDVIDKI